MSFNFEDNFKTPQRKIRRTDGDHLSIPEVPYIPEVPHAPLKRPRPSNFGTLTSTNLSNPHRFGNHPFIFPNIDYEKCKLCEIEEENRMLRHQNEYMRNVEKENRILKQQNEYMINMKKKFIEILNDKNRNHREEINNLKKIIEDLNKEAYENDLLNCFDK